VSLVVIKPDEQDSAESSESAGEQCRG
jgi:hypothetical protein